MENKAVFSIQINENGEIAFTKLADGATKFEQKAKKAKESSHELNNTLQSLRNTMLAGFGAFEAISFGKESEEIYLKVKRADAEIQASLQSTANAAGVTNDQLKEGAEGLYKHSEFTLDNIKRMQSVLLTFPKVAAGQFDEASKAIIDTAAKLGGKDADLQGMAVRIGRALQDPAHGMTMLAREGVNFNKVQIKMVEGLVASGHAVEAQKYILHELETEFGGSAQAALTAGGAHEQMAKTVEELKIQTGQFVSELETDLVPIISEIIGDIGELVKWGEEHKGLIEATVKVVAALAAGYIAYTGVVKLAATADFIFGTSVAELTVGMTEATVATEAETEAMTALDVAMDANPIGLVVGALGGLAAITVLAGNSTETLSYNVTDATGKFIDMKKAVDDVNSSVAKFNAEQDFEKTKQANYAMVGITGKPVSDEENARLSDALKESGYSNKALNKGNTAKKGPGGSGASGIGTPSPDSVKGSDKQIINTWNVKEFGKTVIYPSTMKEGAKDVHDMMLEALTTATNDSEIASGQ